MAYDPSGKVWKSKVHSALIEFGGAYKWALEARRQGVPIEVAHQTFHDTITAIAEKYPTLPERAFDVIYVRMPKRDSGEGHIQWLHWKRYWEPLWQALIKADEHDWAAHQRVAVTLNSYQEALLGRKPAIKFKADLDHTDLFEMGLGLGLDDLTPDELADCFDELCPCGKAHDPESLKRQRQRLRNAFRAAKIFEAKRAMQGSQSERMFPSSLFDQATQAAARMRKRKSGGGEGGFSG